MLKLSPKLSRWEDLWRKKNIIYYSFAWAALSLVVYLFLSGPMLGVERPIWYRVLTYVLQNVALAIAGLLCWRNGASKRMPSGREVWWLFSLALFAFLIGNIFFSLWELVWGLDPVGSLGDPFFLILYICLSLGMSIAIALKRLKLKAYQWCIVVSVAGYAAFLAGWILTPPASATLSPTTSAIAIVTSNNTSRTPPDLISSAPSLTPTASAAEAPVTAPDWVLFFDRLFKPYGKSLSVFYVWCDVFLLSLATIMTIGCWNSRLSNAWQVNSQAIVCFYIADMWLAYATNHLEGYQSGFMLEVCWVCGALLFGVAAALEFEHRLLAHKN
jgi:hypothetical protein